MLNKFKTNTMVGPKPAQAQQIRSSFKTAKGTELPLLNLKGKPYLQVAHRLIWLTEQHDRYRIETEFLALGESHAVCKAKITVYNSDGSIEKYAEATKSETKTGFADFIEKAESGSIGRVLALIGIGTQFTTQEFEEKDRIVDSPVMPGKATIQPVVTAPIPVSGTTTVKLKTEVGSPIDKKMMVTSAASPAEELGFEVDDVPGEKPTYTDGAAPAAEVMEVINALEAESISQYRIFQKLNVKDVFEITQNQLAGLKTSLAGIKSGKLIKSKEFPVKNFAPTRQ